MLVVLGQPGHVEVEGIVGDHPGAVVVSGPGDVRAFGAPLLGVMCQTTLPEERAATLLMAIVAANPAADVRFLDTVCAPTKARQRALGELLRRVDLLVVVGGHNSNNTRKLVATAKARRVPAVHIEGPDELRRSDLRGAEVVGLTAGTSTLPATVDAVEAELRRMATPKVAPHRGTASPGSGLADCGTEKISPRS